MRSKDVVKNELKEKLDTALASQNAEGLTEALADFAMGIQQEVVADFKAFQRTGDQQIMAKRGVRQLTSAEEGFYTAMMQAVRTGDIKQAFTGLENDMQETVIDAVLDDISTAFPLLGAINVQNTAAVTKMLINKKGVQLAMWGALGSKITEELEGAIGKIDITTNKLTAFMPVSKDMLDAGPAWIDANDSMLALQQHLPSTKVETDSYVAVQLLEKAGKLDFNALAEMAEQLEGTFSFTVLDSSNTLFFVRGNNPLCIARFAGSGLVCYASTGEILLKALRQASFLSGTCDVIPIEEGEILSLNATGKIKRSTFDTEKLNRPRFVPSFFSAPYGYRGWFSDCEENGFGNDALTPLLEISHSMGYTEDEVFCLLDAGFCEEEIEEMLLHPSQMQTALAECFYCGYGF